MSQINVDRKALTGGVNILVNNLNLFNESQPAFTCLMLAIETLEKGVQHVQS